MSIYSILIFVNIYSIAISIVDKHYKKIRNQIRILDTLADSEYIVNNSEKIIIIGQNGHSYSSNYVDENGQLFVLSYQSNSKERYVYSLLDNGRIYFNDNPHIYSFNNDITSYTGNTILISSNQEKYLFSIINGDNYFEILDLSSSNLDNNIYVSSTSLTPDSLYIASYRNSLFNLKNEENTFIFTFYNIYTTIFNIKAYKNILLKGKLSVTSGNIAYDVTVQKTYPNLYFSDSSNCFETTNYINCFYLNFLGLIAITILDKDLTLKTTFPLESEITSNDESNFRKGIFLKDELCAYIYFKNDDTKPILYLAYLTYDQTNGYKINFPNSNFNSLCLNFDKDSDNNCDLNDLIKIHDNRFTFISTTKDKKNVIIYLIDLYNNDKNIKIRIYILSLNGYDMHSNLRLFLFKNFIGFNYCYGEQENCGFRILNYANTTDFEKIDDFLTKLDTINPLNLWTNIEIENNLFDYELKGVKIISIPDNEKTRLSIKKLSDLEEIKSNDVLINDSIFFNYIANKTITNGDYIIEFTPIVSEKSYEEFNLIPTVYTIGENVDQESEFTSLEYIGRYGHFPFNLQHHNDFKCHGNCNLCYKSYVSDNEQYCSKCQDNYYFIENTENCFHEPIGYYFNKEKNVYSVCHSLCAKCASKEINSTYMNCLSCIDKNYKYYPKNKNCLNCPKYVNYDQTECIDEIPIKYYLSDSIYGIIENCHILCSICSEGPTSTSMNCDYCIEGYYLKIDNNNNKNCISNDVAIEKNYFKDAEKNIYYECYDLCSTCDNFGNSTNMNCLTCVNEIKYGYDEIYKNCFLNITCNINSSYYYTYDENNLKAKICLDNGQFCPNILPFELISTKECISTCPYEDLINNICKPSNIEVGVELMKETLENEIETNDEMIEDVLNDEFEDITILGSNSTYQITTTSNQEEKINNKVDDSVSNINLGECEKIIKKENNISENVSLIIIKDDLKRNETISTQVEYQVYDPITRKVLNLSSCKNISIKISVPLDVDDKTLDLYKKASEQGYDIFDSESDFYNDVCTVYTSEKGTDMILSDRRSDILNNTPSLCEDGCKYSGVDLETKKALCECSPKNYINTNTSEINFSLKFFEKIFFKLDLFNYKILGCSKLLLNEKNIIHNYGFYIIGFLLLLFFILIPINLISSSYQLKIKCYKIIQDKQNFELKNTNNNTVKKNNMEGDDLQLVLSNTKLKVDNITSQKISNLKKAKTLINNINFSSSKMKRVSLKKNNSLNISNNNKININININNPNQNQNDNNNNIIMNEEKNIKGLKKQKTLNNIKINNFQSPKLKNIRNKIKRRSIAKLAFLDNSNILDNNKKGSDSLEPINPRLFTKKTLVIDKDNNFLRNNDDIKNKKIDFSKKRNIRIFKQKTTKKINKVKIINGKDEKKRDENDNNDIDEIKKEKKLYFENCIKYVPLKQRMQYFYEEELNQMEYDFARQIDKRNFNQYYISLLKKKHLIFFTFFNSDDYNIYLVKISLFICSFSVYIMINTCFYNDSNMRKIYQNNGNYNFIYQLPQIVYSALISSVINIILKALSLSQNEVIKIKQLMKINRIINRTFIMIKNFKKKLIVFNILGFITIFFAFYYITMFCAVYKNTQIHLLKDSFTSFGLTLIYPFGLYLVPGFFRIPSLKSDNQTNLCLYKMSQLISFI